jgi:Rod binding domain-containing protein
MDISTTAGVLQNSVNKQTSESAKREEVATNFEKIFARKLVKELTKDSFKMGDNKGMMGQSNNLYRRHIIDTLASEIAKQRKLGMADLVTKYQK